MTLPEDVRAGPIAIVGIVSAIVLFALTILLIAVFYDVERETIEERSQISVPEKLRAERAKQLEILNSYRKVEGEEGVVRIPIERAMELIVAEEARKGR